MFLALGWPCFGLIIQSIIPSQHRKPLVVKYQKIHVSASIYTFSYVNTLNMYTIRNTVRGVPLSNGTQLDIFWEYMLNSAINSF